MRAGRRAGPSLASTVFVCALAALAWAIFAGALSIALMARYPLIFLR